MDFNFGRNSWRDWLKIYAQLLQQENKIRVHNDIDAGHMGTTYSYDVPFCSNSFLLIN